MKLWNEIYAEFGDRVEGGSIIRAEAMILGLLNAVKPKHVLEIGTLNGLSAVLWAQYAEKVTTIDIADREIRPKVWDFMGVKSKILPYLATDDEDKKNYIEEIEFDLAFIDGLHTGEAVAYDFECVKKCGCVLFHDYKPVGEGFEECTNERFPGIVATVDSVNPPVYLFGSTCSYFGLWLSEDSPVRNYPEIQSLVDNPKAIVRGKRVLPL